MKQAQIIKDTDKFALLKADYGDLDPTSDSKVGLLAGFWVVNKTTNDLQHIGDSLTDVANWVQSVRGQL